MFTAIGTIDQILVAGVAITAISLLLYSLTFNLRVRVARSFALILVCLVIIYTAESLASVAGNDGELELWLHLQWLGIAFIPATYLHFSDAVLATTGKPSKGKRKLVSRLSYLISGLFLITLPLGLLVGSVAIDRQPAPHLQPTWLTDLFILYYSVNMLMSWYNLLRAWQRTATATSKRRMVYLLIGAFAPAMGSFPFLLFSSELASRHMLTFWLISTLANILVGGLIIVMAYAVAYVGVAQPDRTIKSRLLKWILRGPVTASFTLAFSTITRRIGEDYGQSYNAFVPIVMVASILVFEYAITLVFPFLERWFLYGNDKAEIDILHTLEGRLITRNDLRQFLEVVLSAVCDHLQAQGAYVASLNQDGLELVVKIGKTFFDRDEAAKELRRNLLENGQVVDMFNWGNDTLIPLLDQDDEGNTSVTGLLGISGVADLELDDDQLHALNGFSERISLALKDRRLQENVFRTMGELSSRVEYIQNLRAAWRYDQSRVLEDDIPIEAADYSQWVKDALAHYWGGPN